MIYPNMATTLGYVYLQMQISSSNDILQEITQKKY